MDPLTLLVSITVIVTPRIQTVTGSYPRCPEAGCQIFTTLSSGFLRYCLKKRQDSVSLYSSLLFIIILPLSFQLYIAFTVDR